MICNLCPRQCGAVRTETEGRGLCRKHWKEGNLGPQ